MARPAKYDWPTIRKAYEDGLTVSELVLKYRVAKKTLENRISEEKWSVSGELESHVNEFRDSLGKISQNVQDDPIKAEIVLEKLNTILEDNALIGNNRKLLTAFQSLIGRGIKDGAYKTPQDIKAGVSAVKDIEAVSNPSAKIVNNNTNAVQTNIETQVQFYIPDNKRG